MISLAQRERRTRHRTRNGSTDAEIRERRRRFRRARDSGRSRRSTAETLKAALLFHLLQWRHRRIADPARALVARWISWGHAARLPSEVG
jgi:hypothetical protein